MASQVVCGLVFRLLLPVCLAAACLFRYNGFSFVYLIYLLLIPLFPEPTKTTMQGHTGCLVKSLCFTGMAFLLLHIIYQVTINSLLTGDNIEPNFNCSTWEKLVRQLGLESIRGADAGNGIRVFMPDIGMFVAGLVTWLLCLSLEEKPQVKDKSQQHDVECESDSQEKKEEEVEKEEGEKEEEVEKEEGEKEEEVELEEDDLMFEEDFETGEDGDGEMTGDEVEEGGDGQEGDGEVEEESTKMKILRQIAAMASKVKEIIGNLITTAGKVVVTILLGLTGIMLPSLTSAVYFFTFLGLCTWWSFCRTFHPLIFSCLCVLMAIFSAGHLVTLYLYQFQFFQELIPPGDSYASLFGISSVVQTDCSHTWMFRVNPALSWHHYVNPIMLLLLYYTLATLIRLWLQDPTDTVPGEGEGGEVGEGEEPMVDDITSTGEKRREVWCMAHQTDDRNLLSTQDGYSTSEVLIVTSNGSPPDYVHTNGLLGLDLHSTPQYKPGQPGTDLGSVYEVVVVQGESLKEEMDAGAMAWATAPGEGMARANAVVTAFRFIMKQSYICALIAMMSSSPSPSPPPSPLPLLSLSPPSLLPDLRSKWYLVVDRLTVLFLKFLQYFQQLQLTVWWLLELHIIKIVSSYIIWVSVKEVSLFNYVFLVSWAFALPFGQFRPLASSVCTVWTCVIIVCKMLYQLTSINPSTYSKNCSMPLNYTDNQRSEMAHSLLYSAPVDPANWVGLRKFSPLLENLRNNLLILALLAFEVTIYRHQDLYRMRNNLTTPVTRTIFHDITRQHLDDSIVNGAKYFINYFFYKFGLETCLLLAVNVIGQRMDFYAMLHAFGLIAVIYQRRRKAIADTWPKYCCFLACMLTFQYFVCIGVPPAACKDYPWRFPSSSTDSNVIKWLYFPDFHTKPNPMFLLYDFMLLLCASLQRQVFEEEKEEAVRLLAGDNMEICRDLDSAFFSQHNPIPDFIHCRSYLDMLKVIMFSYLFWFVLTIIFITGTTRISIFCMGYLVACFYFLLFGGDLLLKPIKSILHYWDFLIAYNVFVITMKNILSILACGYIKSLVTNHCWLIQLFSLACTIKGYSKPEQQANKHCDLPSDEAGIIWDSICFAFLLLQRRVFMSHYFLHVVADIRSSQILASRGAELFQSTIVKAVKARIEVEKRSMDLLKRQMDRIKSRQQKFKRGKERILSLVQESGDAGHGHSKDEEEEDEDKEMSREKKIQRWWRPWVDHASMVRSGNYYLFETDSEEEEEEDKNEEEQPKKSAFQFVYHAWMTNSKTAMKERSKEKRRFWKNTLKGAAAMHVPMEEEDQEEMKTDGSDNMLKRVFNIVKFSWVLFLAMLDSFTAWINSMCQEHLDISTVLRIERCMLTHEVNKGNKPSRESIHVYYRKQMCKAASIESGLERTEEETCQDCIPHKAESCACLESQESMASHDSLSSAYTESTLLYSCRSTLDHTDMGPDNVQVPKTSERARPKLCKMEGLDLKSTSSADSRGSQASEHNQCIALCSRQGTTDTIEETGEEPDQDLQDPHSSSTSMGLYMEHEGVLLSRSRGLDWDSRDSVPEVKQTGLERGPCYAHHSDLQLYQADLPSTDADIPPSYSRATGLDREGASYSRATGLVREEAERASSIRAHHKKRLVVVTPDEKSDLLSGVTSGTFPSLTHELTASDLLRNRMFYDEELDDSERFYGDQPALLQLLYALYNMLVAHSEMVCFLVIILNHMISASVATLVLPIFIFLWAMLSVPRPSKRFWMTAIVYTEVTIVIKYFFQFGFFPFNQNIELDKSKPFHPPNIIGVEKREGYVHYDLVQLLALFFHRSILKCHGLWDEDNPRGGGRETPKQHHHEREKRTSSRPVEKQAAEGSSSLLESVRNRIPRQFHSMSTSTPLRRKSSSSASHLSQRTVRSAHSKGDSVSSRPGLRRGHSLQRGDSLRRGDSVLSVQHRSKKEMILEKLREQLIKAKSFTVKKTLEIYIPICQFFYNLIHPEYSAVTDVYVLMFLADTVDFIIIVFGFWAFGKHSAAADITSSLSEDQVPEAFLVMVLIQFGTMIIDRALYLRKTVMGKVIFQVILVFGIHFWMFFILPGVTERRFSQNTVAQLWYFVKCIYFGLSAYQIRCGYPTRVLGNFLTKSYNYLNLFLFQGFRLVPFLTELRAVMDWVWTDTTLSLSNWICVEDIYAHIFVLKCWRMSEKRYPQPRGQKKKKVVKYGMGGLIVMLLICIVWFPLLFMSLVKSVAGVVNKPLDVSVTITLGGFQPIFTMSAQQNQLKDISKADFADFMNSYNYIPSAMQFLEAYTSADVAVAELEGSSNSLWTISPPSRKNLMDVLSKEEYFPVTMSWTIQRNLSLGAKAEVATDKHITYLDMTTRQELIDLLNGTRNQAVVIEQVFPCFLRAPSDSNAKPIEQLYKDNSYKNILLALERTHNSSGEIQEWWIVDQPSAGQIQMRGAAVGKKREAGLQLYVFSDKVSPPSLGFLAGYGIMGLYASVVLVIGKFVREFFSGISHSIMFEELPVVDRILKLCTDIFLVRETGELELEEDLYAKLIFLYRSPETMIKWTRHQKIK
ncbi:piezo-type mechanosensitive ion channel component 2 [Oncorhynchus kisutch]|uniref:piezo-type mechanosensitive ion channel component 2 n=1 Tax=Oncorhynchus kisutch TaxID=8019 RepID=UPI0012DBF6B0|nr:piezo-type mechanosensitive ion channel component 2 [Oncorhynchus kisutch]